MIKMNKIIIGKKSECQNLKFFFEILTLAPFLTLFIPTMVGIPFLIILLVIMISN